MKNLFIRFGDLRLLCVFAVLTIYGCDVADKTAEEQASQRVTIIKFVTHPALDATEQGIKSVLENRDISVTSFDAQGNPQVAKQTAETAIANRPDVIVAIATPAAQAVARTSSSVPMIYGAVADPVGAGILNAGNVTGISNVGDHIIQSAIAFIRAAFPDAKRLGIVYNPTEQNSVYVQSLVDKFAPAAGLEIVRGEALDKTQVSSIVESIASRSDVLYSANDNTFNAAIASAASVATAKGKPLVLGDLSTLSKGGTAAVGLDYYEVGQAVGSMVLSILNGTPIETLPPEPAPAPKIWVNSAVVDALGVTMPDPAMKLIDKTFRQSE